MEHYIVVFIYSEKKYYFIWKTDDVDVFLTQNDKIVFWYELDDLIDFSKKNQIEFLDKNEIVYNLDFCISWCNSVSEEINCSAIIGFWNIFFDLYSSIGASFLGSIRSMDAIYEKLFYGNNLPCINASLNKYEPSFSNKEVQNIKNVMLSGIKFFEDITST